MGPRLILKFFGCSDDLVEVEIASSTGPTDTGLYVKDKDGTRRTFSAEEFNIHEAAEYYLFADDVPFAVVTALFTKKGTWAFGFAPWGEDVKWPPNIGVRLDRHSKYTYSSVLEFEWFGEAPEFLRIEDAYA